MNVLLIQPRLSLMEKGLLKRNIDQVLNKLYAPPLTLEQLYALTPEDYEVKIIDERIGTKIDYDGNYDLIGITAFTAYADRAYEIADEFKKRKKKVILGGYHPSALPDEAKKHADSVVIGEAEYTWTKVLTDARNNSLKPFYIADCAVDQNDISSAKRDQTGGNYFFAAIQASRGCPNRCEFCAISNLKYGAIVRKRPVENVVEEIKSIPHKFLHFYDPSLTSHPSYVKSLFKEMNGLNKKFTCNGNVGTLYKDEELLKLASEAGCTKWYIGFESFSQENIIQIGKKTNKVEEYLPAIRKIHDHGMEIHGHFVFGFDHDTTDVFESTLAAINDLELVTAEFHIMTPFPGTPLFSRLDAEGRIMSKDWSRYMMSMVNFKPKLMSEEELLSGVRWLKKEFYSFNNFSRLVNRKENMNFNVLSNMIGSHLFSKLEMRYLSY